MPRVNSNCMKIFHRMARVLLQAEHASSHAEKLMGSMSFAFAFTRPFHISLREFVKTPVILAPVREFSRSRAASKIPFPGAQPGWPGKAGEFQIVHVRCKNRYVRSHVICNVKKT